MKNITLLLVFLFSLQNSFSQSTSEELTASPNPFVSSTNITIYNLDHDTVTLTVFNMAGVKVADVFDSLILSGTITVVFDATSLPDGRYVAVLRKNSKQIGKMLIKISTASIHDEKSNKIPFKIFPNPVEDFLTIKSETSIQACEIYAMNGQLVKSVTENFQKIKLTNLKPGIYILQLKSKHQTYIQRIVKK